MTRASTQQDIVELFLRNNLKPLEPYINSTTPIRSKCLKCKREVSPRADKVRQRGHQCPYCSGRKVLESDAVDKLRKLGHVPLEPFPGALKPWKMVCGGCNSAISPRYNSIQQGRFSCKFCGHKRGGQLKLQLGTPKALEMLNEAGLTPVTDYPGTNAPWKSICLNCGSSCSPRLSGLIAGQGGCKTCGKKSGADKRRKPEKDAILLAKAKQLLPLEPYKSNKSPWKCKCLRCGQNVNPTLQSIIRSVYGCVYCAGKVVEPEKASEIMKKSGLLPLIDYPGNSGKPWLSKCLKCKREVSPRFDSVRAGQGGCIWCSGKKVDPSFAISVMKSKLLQPLEPFISASATWKCKCLRCGKKISTTYKNASNSKYGCKNCAPNAVNKSKIKEIVRKAGFTPAEKYLNASAKWKLIHDKCGRTVEVTYDSLRSGHSCKYCGGTFVDPNEASKVMKDAGLIPLEQYPGARVGWLCQCVTCGRKVKPQYSSVKHRGSGCIYCSGSKVDAKDAINLMHSKGLLPLEPFKSATTPWRSKCIGCNREVAPKYTHLKGGQGGCKFCADWGINYEAPGYIYLMYHAEFQAAKIGIGGLERSRGRSRIKQHEKYGWKLYKALNYSTADIAFQIEQEVLDWIRKKQKLGVYLSARDMPQGGYTETFSSDELSLARVWERVISASRLRK